MGVSRSASTVIAYAMKEYGWTLDKAYNFVKQKRSVTRPNPGFMRQLAEYEGILDARCVWGGWRDTSWAVAVSVSCCFCLSPDLPFWFPHWSPPFLVSSVTTSCGSQMQTARWARALTSWPKAVKERRDDSCLKSPPCLPVVKRECLRGGLLVPPHARLFRWILILPTIIIISAGCLTRRSTASRRLQFVALLFSAWKKSL